jgi:hypothetical protein
VATRDLVQAVSSLNQYIETGEDSYSFHGQNHLAKRICNDILSENEFELNTDRIQGLHSDKSVDTIELYLDSEAISPTLFHLNGSYWEKKQSIQRLNNARCVVYHPLIHKSNKTWYEEELQLEQMRNKYPDDY